MTSMIERVDIASSSAVGVILDHVLAVLSARAGSTISLEQPCARSAFLHRIAFFLSQFIDLALAEAETFGDIGGVS